MRYYQPSLPYIEFSFVLVQSIKCTFETREGSQYMSVYVEPAEWNGDESERPIKLLKVQATSYNGDDFIRGERAVSSTDPC